jgi:hypothetical protein
MPILGVIASQISGHLYTNSYNSIATVTVGSGGSSSITFSSIPQGYTHLQVRAFQLGTGTGTGTTMQVGNGTIDTGSNYSSHWLYGSGTAANASASVSGTNWNYYYVVGNSSTSNPEVEIWDILDYANTNKYKTSRCLAGVDNNGSGEVFFTSGLWQNTASINTIKINATVNNFAQYSSFALYGVA